MIKYLLFIAVFMLVFFFIYNVIAIIIKTFLVGFILFIGVSLLIPTRNMFMDGIVYLNSFNEENYKKYKPKKFLILHNNITYHDSNHTTINIHNKNFKEIKSIILEWKCRYKCEKISILLPRFQAFNIMLHLDLQEKDNVYYIVYTNTHNPMVMLEEFSNFVWAIIEKFKRVFTK